MYLIIRYKVVSISAVPPVSGYIPFGSRCCYSNISNELVSVDKGTVPLIIDSTMCVPIVLI